MDKALVLAAAAGAAGEVPVGAVVVIGSNEDERGVALASKSNSPISDRDPSAHAEMNAIRLAGQVIQNYRLVDATIYVTLEPCMMCAGAMVHARIKRLVYGALEPKSGAVCSHPQLNRRWHNHVIEIVGGVRAKESGDLLTEFFAARRSK
ncbi:MAG: tRNA(adenine34) deaminase [Limisphaerales bacterium]|jgi:tRNA(adenine34) deaminase